MTASIAETIKMLSDSDSAKIDIPTIDGPRVRLNCIYKESESPAFFLVFPPKRLPDDIDMNKSCPVSINNGDKALTLSAEIVEIKGDRTMELVARKKLSPESLREFFRVDTRVPVHARFHPPSLNDQRRRWSLDGWTLNLSGSGALTVLPEEPKTRNKIELFIHVDAKSPIECLAHIVTIKHIRRAVYQVSFHFDDISQKDKDSIISFCLKEQRNQLRNQIQTVDDQ